MYVRFILKVGYTCVCVYIYKKYIYYIYIIQGIKQANLPHLFSRWTLGVMPNYMSFNKIRDILVYRHWKEIFGRTIRKPFFFFTQQRLLKCTSIFFHSINTHGIPMLGIKRKQITYSLLIFGQNISNFHT